MEPQSFNLLSEDYDDVEFIELFGSEYLSLDSEYQREASIQKIEKVDSPMVTKKAQAKYERESAAKLTKYTLEPTFQIPSHVRITLKEPEVKGPSHTPPWSEEPPQVKVSNKKFKKELYKATRREIRRARRPGDGATSATTTSKPN